jgi:hypothetical protein
MPTYRTYIIGRADHYWGAEDIECADDQQAIQNVQRTMDGRDVEVWERGRFIVRLSSDRIPKHAASGGGVVSWKAHGTSASLASPSNGGRDALEV